MQPDPQPTLDLEAIRERFRAWRDAISTVGQPVVDVAYATAAECARMVPPLLAALEEARRERGAGVGSAQAYMAANIEANQRIRARDEALAAARAEVQQLRQRLDLAEGRIDGDAWDRLTEERDGLRRQVDAVRALLAPGTVRWTAGLMEYVLADDLRAALDGPTDTEGRSRG